MSNIKTTLHYYNFDISTPEQKAAYTQFCDELKAKGLVKFDAISERSSYDYFENHIIPLDGQEIELETKYLFDNQWNSAPTQTSDKGLRLMDWDEPILPNRKIKKGYWLEQTQEMKDIRAHTYKCGYCGAQYFKPSISFCDKCLNSEYLKETELKLLFLHPVSAGLKRSYEGVNLPDELLAEYYKQQQAARSARLEKRQQDKLASLQNDIAAAKKEYAAFSMLIKYNIDFENVIYYKHTDTFCFGWRNALTESEAENLRLALNKCGFREHFKSEIKTAKGVLVG